MSVQTITANVLRAAASTFKAVVLKQMATRTPQYKRFVTEVNSSGAARVVFAALGDFPTMREFKGKADIKEVIETGWETPNLPYHNTINVPREHLERGDLASHTLRLQMIGDDAAVFPDKLMATRLMNGFTKKCYTGKNFYDENHTHFKGGKKVFSNVSDLKLAHDSYTTARVSLMSVQHENGDAFATEIKLVLMVGPTNLDAAEKIINAATLASGATNTAAKTAELVVNPLITDDSWHLLNLGSVIRPLVFAEEIPVELNFAEDKGTSDFILEQRFLFQAYRRGNLDYLFPQCAYGSEGTEDPA